MSEARLRAVTAWLNEQVRLNPALRTPPIDAAYRSLLSVGAGTLLPDLLIWSAEMDPVERIIAYVLAHGERPLPAAPADPMFTD